MKKLRQILWLPVLLIMVGTGILRAGAAGVGSREIDVNARYKTIAQAPASYSVDLFWSDMTFTYTNQQTRIWNPKDHSYKTRSSGKWDKTRGTITVTNHSNVDVNVTVTYTPLEETGITGTLKNPSGKLKAGKEGDYEGADSMTTTLVISGKPTAAVTDQNTKIGSLKITIQ